MSLKEKAIQFRKAAQYNILNADMSNNDALAMASIYNYWKPGISYGGDNEKIVRRIINGKDILYKIIQPHISQNGWEPENTPALWEHIDIEHSGTIDDPIPAILNMQYYNGKYYIEDEILYLCTRDSGISLAYLPSQLVGQYFEIIDKE